MEYLPKASTIFVFSLKFRIMYEILHGTHSGMRWIALLLLLIAIVNAAGSKNSGDYGKKDKLINLFAMISLHIQLLIGGALMFLSPKVAYVEGWMSSDTAGGMYRFYGLEHILLMIVAIVIITRGRSKAEKKLKGTRDKHKKITLTYTIGLILILISIPWPFRTALLGSWM